MVLCNYMFKLIGGKFRCKITRLKKSLTFKKLPNDFQKFLYNCKYLPALNENSHVQYHHQYLVYSGFIIFVTLIIV